MKIVEVKNVEKWFDSRGKKVYALENMSFEIKKGEIFGLLGPNGAGKTTMIHILLDILKHDKGCVKIFGKDPGPQALERMNLVSNDVRFHWVLPCREILVFYGYIYGVDRQIIEKRIDKLAKIFRIEYLMERRFQALSTGERMRMNFAKALINKPDLLLLDEPTLGLDPDIAIDVRNEIKTVNKKFNTTILLTSHYMNEVEQLCNRIAFMEKGSIIDIGNVEKIKLKNFDSYELIITVHSVKSRKELLKNGFKINKNVLRKTLHIKESMSKSLSFLYNLGMIVKNVETRKPTLEDYFVKMAKKVEK